MVLLEQKKSLDKKVQNTALGVEMAKVSCGCGQAFEILPTGEGYEEFRNHLRMEQRSLSGEQWILAQHKIKEAEESKKEKKTKE